MPAHAAAAGADASDVMRKLVVTVRVRKLVVTLVRSRIIDRDALAHVYACPFDARALPLAGAGDADVDDATVDGNPADSIP